MLNVMTERATSMGLIAAGAYIRTLRDALGLRLEDVAAAANTSESQVSRIENGEQETRGSLLLAIVRAVRGRAEHIQDLILDNTLTAEDGKKKAQEWFTRAEVVAGEEARQMTDEELVARLGELDQKLETALALLKHNPELVERLRAYAAGLIDAQTLDLYAQSGKPGVIKRLLQRKRGSRHPTE